MASIWEFTSRNEQQTFDAGRRLGKACQGGEIILLEGPLGAGKTCMAGGLANGLGIQQPTVSPTFIILRSYPAARGLTLHHLDFYRLGGDGDLETIGLEDCFGPQSIILAEWPSRCPQAFNNFSLLLEFKVVDETTRSISGRSGDLAADHLIAALGN